MTTSRTIQTRAGRDCFLTLFRCLLLSFQVLQNINICIWILKTIIKIWQDKKIIIKNSFLNLVKFKQKNNNTPLFLSTICNMLLIMKFEIRVVLTYLNLLTVIFLNSNRDSQYFLNSSGSGKKKIHATIKCYH